MRSNYTVPDWATTITSSSETMLLVIDMQDFFLKDPDSPWSDPSLMKIVPNIKSLVRSIGARSTLFTLFMPPVDWQYENKSWRTYYYANQGVTTEMLGTKATEIVSELQGEVADPATKIAAKKTASAFSSQQFKGILDKEDPLFLVISGIETDYCVLATALDALNKGYYVVIPTDACASSKIGGQSNAEGIFSRFPEQVWITDTATLLDQIA